MKEILDKYCGKKEHSESNTYIIEDFGCFMELVNSNKVYLKEGYSTDIMYIFTSTEKLEMFFKSLQE